METTTLDPKIADILVQAEEIRERYSQRYCRQMARYRHLLEEMGLGEIAGGATGTAVSTGDIITAAKTNLKQETGVDLANLSINDTGGDQQLAFVVNENLSADRTLNFIVNDADRTINLSGNLTLGGTLTTAAAFTVSGAFALTLTVGNTTNATIPSGTVTLMDLSTAQTVTGAKRFADDAILIENPAATFYYTVTGAALAANRVLNLPLLTGTDTVVTADFIQTLTNKTLTSPTINTPTIAGGTHTALTSLGIRSTGAAFDLTIASTEVFTAGRTLTITLNNAARTVDIAGNLILAAAFTTVNASSITLTTAGATALTLPTSGTLAILGANTFTGAQTFDGNVDTVLNISASPVLDIGADVFETGTFIDIAYDTAETLTAGTLIGLNLDFNTNLTYATTANIVGVQLVLAAFTQPDATTTTIYGFNLPTAGALVQNTAAGVLDWRGVNIQLPNTTQTTGTVTAYGIRITEGTTASGSVAGLYIDVDLAIDLVTLGNRIDFDADNDTSLRASGDDILMWEVAGTDFMQWRLDGGVATLVVQAGTATEIGLSVTNAALTVGTAGSVVIPYLDSTGAAFTDVIGGNINGAIGINYDNDTGPTSTLEVRSNGAWVSVAVSGYVMQSKVPWMPNSIFLSHPAQLFENGGRTWIDESRCYVCGEPMEPGQQANFWVNGRYDRGVHAIFGHLHLEREPRFSTLEDRMEAVEEALDILRAQVRELGAVPVA